jgi:hypothetical protein
MCALPTIAEVRQVSPLSVRAWGEGGGGGLRGGKKEEKVLNNLELDIDTYLPISM